MKILPVGVDNTVEIYRDDPDVTMTLAVIDPATGETLASPVVTNDDTDLNIAAAIEEGDSSFDVVGDVVQWVDYLVQHDPVDLGPQQTISTIAVGAGTGTTVKIKYPFFADMAAGCQLKGIRSSATYSPTSAYAGKPLWLQWTDSNGVITREWYLVVAFELKCPIKSDNVRDRWPRVSLSAIPTWQQVSQVGWQPQVDDAWNELRDEFYTNGLILDQVVSASLLEEVTYALIEKRLLNMGEQPAGQGESIRDSQNRIAQKVTQLLTKAFGLPLQTDTGDNNTGDGRGNKRSMVTNIWRAE